MLAHIYNIIIDRKIVSPGSARDVIDGLNDTDKLFLPMFMTTVRLHGEARYDSQMKIHASNVKAEIIITREFQKNLSYPTRKNLVMDRGKYIKQASERKCTESEYHVQYRKDVPQISVKMSCATTQFPILPFFGLHVKHQGVIGLIKHYHFQLYPKLVHGKCAIQ